MEPLPYSCSVTLTVVPHPGCDDTCEPFVARLVFSPDSTGTLFLDGESVPLTPTTAVRAFHERLVTPAAPSASTEATARSGS